MLTQSNVEQIAREARVNPDVVEDRFDELYEFYLNTNQMPYGTAKARIGDPYQWIEDQLTKEII